MQAIEQKENTCTIFYNKIHGSFAILTVPWVKLSDDHQKGC